MGELSTNPLWDIGADDCPSPYARMIPGASARTAARFAPMVNATTKPVEGIGRPDSGRATMKRRALSNPYSVQPAVDQFTFTKVMATDLLVLLGVSGGLSLIHPSWGLALASVPIFALLVTLIGFSEGLYKDEDRCPTGLVVALAQSILLAVGLIFIAAAPYGMRFRAAFATSAVSLTALVVLRRLSRFVSIRKSCDAEPRKILIVGGGPIGRSIARALRNDPVQRAIVCGFVDDEMPLSPAVLGRIGDLDWLTRAEFIDEVILALPGQPEPTRQAAEVAYRNHLDIRAVPDLPPGPWPDSSVDHIGEVPVITLHREALPSASLFLKRLLDVVGAGIGLVLTSPLMAVVALMIKLESPGPVVYSAERTGAKGRRFRCYKFRSMVTDAADLKEDLRSRNQRHGPIFKLDDDPRVTRIGRVIRRYSLDELPQLWNVLRGEMSLVGPRPHPVDEVNHYELQHFRRLDVKPGITGLWQITARDCPSFELNMHLDLTYIENWSLRLDLRILAGTVRVLFAPEGA